MLYNLCMISRNLRLKIYKRDNYVCYICKKSLKNNKKIRSLDHVLARANGGTNSPNNLKTCCYKCNNNKANTTDIRMLILKFKPDWDYYKKS